MIVADSTGTRSYGCSYGCGNAYDVVVVMVQDGTTEFLCLPCFVRLASEVATALTDPENAKVIEALRQAGHMDGIPTPGPTAKAGRKNAPAGTDDPDLIAAYDDVVTEDELPAEFR